MENVLMLPFETTEVNHDLEFLKRARNTYMEFLNSDDFVTLPEMSQGGLRSFLPLIEFFANWFEECRSPLACFLVSLTKVDELSESISAARLFDESWDDVGGKALIREVRFKDLFETLGVNSYVLRQSNIVLEDVAIVLAECVGWCDRETSPGLEERNAKLKVFHRQMLNYLQISQMYYGTLLAWTSYANLRPISTDSPCPAD